MDIGAYVVEDEFNRIQGAMLTIHAKKFSIYKGVNIIGRNKSATVNIKNLNVSQHHAMIIIVDDSQHYISDLNSSNGTYLLGNKITPFKLYEITNNTEIKFGDVSASYDKMPDTNTTIHLQTGTMEATQNFSQTFYAAQTQALLDVSSVNQSVSRTQSLASTETQDIHEAPTQMVVYPPFLNGGGRHIANNSEINEEINMDIHNAPTQVVTNEEPSTSNVGLENIHEAVTQPITYPRLNTNVKHVEENIHEAVTQVVNYLPERIVIGDNRQELNLENSVAQENLSMNFVSVIEETVIEESVIEEGPSNIVENHIEARDDENSNDSVDFLTIDDVERQNIFCSKEKNTDENSPTLATQDIGGPTKRPVQKLDSSESLLEPEINKQICNSDSETDVDDVTKANFKRKGRVIDSDSETDIEDTEIRNILRHKEDSQNGTNKTVKLNFDNKATASDSETDIEDNGDISVAQSYIDKNKTEKKPLRKLSSSQSDIESKTNEGDSEQNSEVITRRRTNKARIINSDSDTDMEDDRSKDEIFSKEKPKGSKLNVHSDSETDVEDDEGDKCDVKKKPYANSDSDTDIETDKKTSPVRNEDDNTAEGLNDTDCIPATQDAFANVFQYAASKSSNLNSENVSSEESFKLGLTELMVDENDLTDRSGRFNKKSEENSPIFGGLEEPKTSGNREENGNSDFDEDEGKSKTSNKDSNAVTEVEDDPYLMATQKIEDKTEKIGHSSKVSADSNDEKNKENEDIYNMATQKLGSTEMLNVERNTVLPNNHEIKTTDIPPIVENDADENIYLLPTQIIKTKTSLQKEILPSSVSKANTDQEKDDEIYMLATQKIDEDAPKFKTPQKFTFKRKTANLDGSLTTILGNAQNIDLPSADALDLDETCSKIDDVRLINDSDVSGGSKENVDDIYLQPTQDLTEPSNMQMDPYTAETQEVKDDFVSENDKKAEKIYVEETQTKLHLSTNEKIAVPSTSKSDSHLLTKDAITDFTNKSNKTSPKRVKKSDIENLKKTLKSIEFEKSETSEKVNLENELEPDRPETLSQIEAFIKKPLRNNTESEEKLISDAPTQPLVNLLMDSDKGCDEMSHVKETGGEEDLSATNLKRVGEACLAAPKMKKVKKSDLASLKRTIESSKAEEAERNENYVDADRPETLSQIETFIKRPLRTYKAPKRSENRYPTAKSIENDILQESETLSQIEDFVKKPLDNLSNVSTNTRIVSPNRDEEECPETLSQIERFVKKPLTPRAKRVSKIKSGASSISTSSKTVIQDTESCSSASNRVDLENVLNSPKRNKGKLSRINEDSNKEQNTKLEKNISSKEYDNPCTSKSSEQDTIKTDIDQSFALLEAKSTKTRKSQRVTNVGEVKVAVRKNRRSMAISSVTELAEKEGTKKKPSTRKSSRVLNNNIEPAAALTELSIDSISERGQRNESKPECSDSNFSEPEVPAKISRMSTVKRGKTNTKTSGKNDTTNIENKEVPVTAVSKTRASVRMRASNCDDIKSSGSESESSVSSLPVTASKRSKKSAPNIETTPSTSKTKTNSRLRNRSDSSTESKHDSGSVSSGDFVFSTPSRRASAALNDTALTMSERSKRKLRPKVVFTMLDSPQLESLIRHLGGSIVDTVDASTVLVTEHVKRSQKLLSAVGQGKPICSPQWIHASKKANEFLDPWDFILVDKEAESKWDFSLKDSIRRATNGKLLTNYTFQLMVSAAADVLKGSIEACGGKCVKTTPKNVEGYLVVVASPENRSKFLKVKKQHPDATIVEPEAVFDGVLRQELRLGRHLLT